MLNPLLGLALAAQGSTGTVTHCELHVFPTERVTVATSLGPGLLLGGLLAGRDQPKDIFLRDLPRETQVSAVAEIPDLASSLGYPSLVVKAASAMLDFKTAKKTITRQTSSQTPCYSELILTDIVYTSNALNGRHIGSMSVLRRFEGGRLISARQMGGAGKLSLYPPTRAEDHPAARLELIGAFREAVRSSIHRFAK